MPAALEIKYFNSFWLKKVIRSGDTLPSWPGLPWDPTGYPIFPFNDHPFADVGTTGSNNEAEPWFIEESKIKGGYNNTTIDLGVKAYVVSEKRNQEHKGSGLIYSGIFNSRTGINQTNVFSVGQSITKGLDPISGTIQKTFAEDTNLIIFQENKSSRLLIDKDTIYTTEGGTQTQQGQQVLGQLIPYLGEYGISTNPESFAVYGFQKYFADKNRGVICRLSRDGVTEISAYGMTNYFRDFLSSVSTQRIDNTVYEGTVDIIQVLGQHATIPAGTFNTNWPSFTATQPVTILSVLPTGSFTCNNITLGSIFWFYKSWPPNPGWNTGHVQQPLTVIAATEYGGYCIVMLSGEVDPLVVAGTSIKFVNTQKGKILGAWDIHNRNYVVSMQHATSSVVAEDIVTYEQDGELYNTVTFDEQLNGWSSFHTYKPDFAGSLKGQYYTFHNGQLWKHYDQSVINNRGNYYDNVSDSSVTFLINPIASVAKNFQTINYEGSNGWEVDSFKSGAEGPDVGLNPAIYNSYQDKTSKIYSYQEGEYVDPTTGITHRAGFTRKENKYTAPLINQSSPRPGEVLYTDSYTNEASAMSGIKGYFATVKVSTDNVTNPGSKKELFAVGSKYVISSV